jgi:uncharacterized lipoprotein YddW (UPF0748 family)
MLVACGASPDPNDAGRRAEDAGRAGDAGGENDGGRDAGIPTVAVAHARELRGAWIATVYGLDYPSRAGLNAAEARAEIAAILELMRSTGLNAAFFQVRPESDALYRSDLEPWSRFLTGTQGADPGYDPLAIAIEEAHARGIELHAWINPYRAKASAGSTAVAPHVTITLADHAIHYGEAVTMDPGAAPVRDHVVAVIRDIVRRYDVDGIHFDDYFYPYPVAGETFDDADTYAAYQAGGGALSLADWRRENVNLLVGAVAAMLEQEKPWVRFGISPFGIYRPGMPEGITGLDAYASIYCDSLRWLTEGWIDYVAPQLYWPTTQTAQAYGALIEWWADRAFENGRYVFAGNALSRVGSSAAWTAAEIEEQVRLSRALSNRGSLGNLFFRVEMMQTNVSGVTDALRTNVYTAPAIPPPLASAPAGAPAPPRVDAAGNVAHAAPETLRGFTIYAADGTFDRFAPGPTLALTSGSWIVSAVDRFDRESGGVAITVP